MLHNTDELNPDSNEFYKIAFEYAIMPDFEYVGDSCDIQYSVVRSLSRDKRFLDLVEEIKKGFKDNDPFAVKLDKARLKSLREVEKMAYGKTADEKNKLKANELLLTISRDIPKGAASNQKSNNNQTQSVKIAINRKKFTESGSIVDKEDWEE